MEHLQNRLDALKQQEANLLMQLDEVRVLIQAYENTINKDEIPA
jgi:chaperonin cofactor prefoldin